MDKAEEERITLKFLHDAFFYFLTNKGNAADHLQAIMTMLDFSNEQKADVLKRRGKSHWPRRKPSVAKNWIDRQGKE